MADSDDTWRLVSAMFGSDPAMTLARHQHDSFADFIGTKIRAIMDGFNPLELHSSWNEEVGDYEIKMAINIVNMRLQRPMTVEVDGSSHAMTPTEARRRGLTYAAAMYADIEVKASTLSGQAGSDLQYVHDSKTLQSVSMGHLPIMVRSDFCLNSDPHLHAVAGECANDPGGYFIVSGSERALISHDRMAENRTFVFPSSKCTAFSHTAEVRSLMAGDFGVPKITGLRISAKGNEAGRYIQVTAHHVRNPVPLFVVFRAFGVLSDADIFALIAGRSAAAEANIEVLAGCAAECARAGVYSQEQAEEYLLACTTLTGCPREYCASPEYERDALRRMLRTEILPHVGEALDAKATYLAEMARRLLLVAIGHSSPDDRDSYVSKRVDAPGVMLANLLRQYYGKMVKEARKGLYKELNAGTWRTTGSAVNAVTTSNVFKLFKGTTIGAGMRYALATGAWGVKTGSKQGVSQVLNRLTYCATLSHLRRVATSIEKNSKLVQPRKLNGTQWGVFCPAETPEGQSVGVVKNMAISACITVAVPATSVLEFLEATEPDAMRIGPIKTGGAPSTYGAVVRVNSTVWGEVPDAPATVARLRAAKIRGQLHPYTAVVWSIEDGDIAVCTEGGRMVRPLLPVKDGRAVVLDHLEEVRSGKLDWAGLMQAGCIEYLDVEEAGAALIAMSAKDVGKRTTHVEVHPSLALGVLASLIPFPDHNQSPRNSYQSAMGKQATGLPVANFRDRFDIGGHIMDYLQRPLVSSRVADMIGANEMPAGINAIVAVCTCAGYNQEDAVVLNRSAAQRGLFTTTYYHTVREQLAKNHSSGEEEVYYKPDDTTARGMQQCFDKIQADGFPLPGTRVGPQDVIIGKGMPNRGECIADSSVALRANEGGFVDKVVHSDKPYRTTNGDGYSFCKVRIIEPREPQIGDKLSSRSGQKGTIGMTVSQEDLPWTETGLVPDVIINPHAFPSRMTVGMVCEAILGKLACKVGCFGDGTPFTDVNARDICERLRQEGMEMMGDEVMYDPRTGRQWPVAIFVTPTCYQRLKHMVHDKVIWQSLSLSSYFACDYIIIFAITGCFVCRFTREEAMDQWSCLQGNRR
jgi:DNA-directed RNA polymerase II subunit RPB2